MTITFLADHSISDKPFGFKAYACPWWKRWFFNLRNRVRHWRGKAPIRYKGRCMGASSEPTDITMWSGDKPITFADREKYMKEFFAAHPELRRGPRE